LSDTKQAQKINIPIVLNSLAIQARVQCFGIPIHSCLMFEKEVTIPINDLPDWMTRRVAVLCTMSYEPPTEYVNKIGRRIDKYVYWIFYEGDEDDGNDTREES
jgi:hypothetical protein